MANFTQIIQEINDDINTNGVGAITGAKLNEVLRDMIAAVNAEKQDPLTIDATPTEDSTNPVQSGGVYEALEHKPTIYHITNIQAIPPTIISILRAGDILRSGGEHDSIAVVCKIDNNDIYFVSTDGDMVETFLYRNGVFYDYFAYQLSDLANKVPDATQGDLAGLDSDGNLTDSGIAASDVATTSDLAGKQDVISDLATIRSGAAAGATAYQKPSGGIPKTDFASGVQTSLGKADTAFQKPSDGIPESDLSSDVQQALQKHFKGWYDTLEELKAAHTATDGDSAYVKDASPATTWSIYVYDSTASSDNYWADSGTDADTSNVQTFASGEEVNETRIDDTLTKNSDDLAKSGNVYDKIFVNFPFNIEDTVGTVTNGIIYQGTGKFTTEYNINQYNGKIFSVDGLQGKTIRITAKKNENIGSMYTFLQNDTLVNGQTPSYAGNYTDAVDIPNNSYIDVEVPQDAYYLWYYYLRGHDITPTFECYGDVALKEELNLDSKGKVTVLAVTAHNQLFANRFNSVLEVAKGAFTALSNKQSDIFKDTHYWDNIYAVEMPSCNASLFQQTELNVLAKKNENAQYINGSTTKVMSLIAGLDYVNDMGEIVTIKSTDIESGSGNLNIAAGDTISIKDIIFGMMVPSSNTLAHAFGRYVGYKSLTNKGVSSPTDSDCTSEFIDIMNRKAALIGMSNSHFASASGNIARTETLHYSTPHDLCLMALIASSINEINDAWGLKSDFTISFGGSNPHTETLSRDYSAFPDDLNPTNSDRVYNILGLKDGSQDYGSAGSYHSMVMVLQKR